MTPQWDKRIQRARELASQYTAAAQVLGFYAEVASFQKDIYDAATRDGLSPDPSRPLREQFAMPWLSNRLPLLFDLVEKKGPAGLAKAARELKQQPRAWDTLLATQAEGQEVTQQFFVRACTQPFAEYLVSRSNAQWTGYTGSTCPLCNGKLQVGVLRPEGEGAKRSLVCSVCATEWDFRRILCPFCGEEDPAKLPRFSAADEFPHVYVEACDTCKRYFKTVDLSINGLAIPLVDEIAAASLDVWAAEHGYQKIELNLMGL
jgi:FdhE protein